MFTDGQLVDIIGQLEGLRKSTVITDRSPRPIPPMSVPARGVVWSDPTFSSRMTRVTDEFSYPIKPRLSFRGPSGSPQRAWNADSTMFYIVDTWGNFHIYGFNPLTMGAYFIRTLSLNGDASWHDRNPDMIYGRFGRRQIHAHNARKNTTQLVVDLDTLNLGLTDDTYTGNIIVNNDTLIVSCGGTSNDFNHIVIWYPLSFPSSIKIKDTKTFTQYNNGAGFWVHSTSLDQQARYVILQPSNVSNDPGHLYVWDTNSDSVSMVSVGTSGHFALGWGGWVNQDAQTGPWDAAQWTSRLIGAPNTPVDIISPILLPKEVYLGEHPCWNNSKPDMQQPFLSSTYRYAVTDVPWRAWDNEIITIQPQTGVVKRYAHHRSEVMLGGSWTFWATPRATISPCGRWALFTSNWDKTLGIDSVEGNFREDVFIVELR